MLRLYVDESGTLSRYYPEKTGSCRFFSLAMVGTEHDAEVAGMVADFVEQVGGDELKYTNSTETMERRFATKLGALLKQEKASIYGVVIDTEDMPYPGQLINDFDWQMYEKLCTLLAVQMKEMYTNGPIELIIDKKWKKSRREAFDAAIQKKVQDVFYETEPTVRVEHKNSKAAKNVQCADMVAGFIREEKTVDVDQPYYQKYMEDYAEINSIDPKWREYIERP